MKDGVCPKCGSEEVYTKDLPSYYHTNQIPISAGGFLPDFGHLVNYVCINCGYMEHYLRDFDAREYIPKHWDKVRPKPEQ